jgi:hypothetical protein
VFRAGSLRDKLTERIYTSLPRTVVAPQFTDVQYDTLTEQGQLSSLDASGGIRIESGQLRISYAVSADLAVSIHARGCGGARSLVPPGSGEPTMTLARFRKRFSLPKGRTLRRRSEHLVVVS